MECAVKKVLMVDDDGDIRRIGQVSLQKVGKWNVALASSGHEGVKLAVREQPDVILLDVMMPELDGPSTLAKLKSQPETAGIPVIFMTAKVLRSEVEEYLSLGAHGVIVKPFDPMTLPTQIREILSKEHESV